MKRLIFAFVLVLGFVFRMEAASGISTQTKEYCSENKKYCLKIEEPHKPEPESSDAEDNGDESEGMIEEVVEDNFCSGTFFENNRQLWKTQLEDEDLPENVLISNDGGYVVTFGDRDNVVVIFNGLTGRLIKKLEWTDFLTGSDVSSLRARSGSGNWYRKPPFIDYDRSELVLSIVNPHGTDNFFNVRIDLTDGATLDEVVDRIPVEEMVLITKNFEENQTPRLIEGRKNECESNEEVFELSTVDFALKVVQTEPLQISAVARAVRAIGEAAFEVVVSKDGEVVCTRQVSGHPLMRIGVENSIKNWKFEKRETKYKGRIVVEIKMILTLNGKPIE